MGDKWNDVIFLRIILNPQQALRSFTHADTPYTEAHADTQTQPFIHTHAHTHTVIQTCIHTHAHIHSHTATHIHMQTLDLISLSLYLSFYAHI